MSENANKEAEGKDVKVKQPAPAGAVATSPVKANEGNKQSVVYQEYAPRQVSLLLNRIDPWSVMKTAFLISVVFGIATILAAAIIWGLLNAMHVLSSISDLVKDLDSNGDLTAVVDYIRFPRVMALATITAIFNTVLITALATISALIYNLCASLVGGIKVTLMDD